MNWLTLLAPQGVLIRLGAVTLLAVAIFCFGWVKGAGHVEEKWERQTAQIERAHDAEISRLALIKTKVETRYVERSKTARRAVETIVKEVPVYVTAQDDAACHIPTGFVSLLNRAAQGSLPGADPAGVADDPATVARTVTR
jgi:hypothetical protein